MSYILRSVKNAEIVVDDNCGKNKFFAIAQLLQNDLKISFLNKISNTNILNWDFNYKKKLLTLHFDVYGGVIIQENISNNNEQLVCKELDNYLHSKAY